MSSTKGKKGSNFLKELESYKPKRSSFGVGLSTPKTSYAYNKKATIKKTTISKKSINQINKFLKKKYGKGGTHSHLLATPKGGNGLKASKPFTSIGSASIGGGGGALTSTLVDLSRLKAKNKKDIQPKDRGNAKWGIHKLGDRWVEYRTYLSKFNGISAIREGERMKYTNPWGIYEYPNARGRLVATCGSDLMVWITLASSEYWGFFVSGVYDSDMEMEQAKLFINKIARTIQAIIGFYPGTKFFQEVINHFL